MDHTTFIVVVNNYGGIITQVAGGYNTGDLAGHIRCFQPLCVLLGLCGYRERKIFTLLYGSFPRLREFKL